MPTPKMSIRTLGEETRAYRAAAALAGKSVAVWARDLLRAAAGLEPAPPELHRPGRPATRRPAGAGRAGAG